MNTSKFYLFAVIFFVLSLIFGFANAKSNQVDENKLNFYIKFERMGSTVKLKVTNPNLAIANDMTGSFEKPHSLQVGFILNKYISLGVGGTNFQSTKTYVINTDRNPSIGFGAVAHGLIQQQLRLSANHVAFNARYPLNRYFKIISSLRLMKWNARFTETGLIYSPFSVPSGVLPPSYDINEALFISSETDKGTDFLYEFGILLGDSTVADIFINYQVFEIDPSFNNIKYNANIEGYTIGILFKF